MCINQKQNRGSVLQPCTNKSLEACRGYIGCISSVPSFAWKLDIHRLSTTGESKYWLAMEGGQPA
jgi:hypothetical protein